MVLLLSVFVGVVLTIGVTEGAAIEFYKTKYDHIDVDAILNNRRMVNYYAACMLSTGPCPPEGMDFKRILPDALRTNCAKCTEKQKTVTLRAIRRLKKEYPKIWAQMAKQWDPDDIYVKKFESTFGGKQFVAVPQPPVQIQNRFGEGEDKGITNAIDEVFTSSTTASPPTKISTSTTPSTTSTTSATSTSIVSSTTTSTSTTIRISNVPRISVTTSTNKPPNLNTIATSAKPTKRPRPNLGASIQATVSLGPRIVGEFVRGIGAIGTRVVETGAEIAGVVLRNIARPL